LEKYFFIN